MLLDPLLLVRAANATFGVAADLSPALQCKDIDHCRTLQSIVYSCLTTVFLCTWTALHLNVPREPKKPTPLRRVWIMLGALLGPEVVFAFAYGDWTDSSELLRKVLQYSPTCGWTETHAQFAVMGGFRLRYADGETELMREHKLFDRVKDGTIDLPDISEAQILERSKADPIAKSITLIQTAWFVIQCIHRRSQSLPLTELEVTTLGHTLINFFIYWFWWYKPMGIAFPIDIPSKKSKNYLNGVEGKDEKKESKRNSSNDVVTQFLKPDHGDEGEGSTSAVDEVLSFMSLPAYLARQMTPTAEVEEELPPTRNNEHGKAPENNVPADPKLSDDKSIDSSKEPNVDVEAVAVIPPRISLYTRMGIKTFYVSDADLLSQRGLIAMSIIFFIIGGSFGAMHCLAWNLQFPTRAEQYLWQVSSLIVTIIGGIVMVMAINDSEDSDFWVNSKRPGPWIAAFFTFVYSCARISLLVLALLQLRALPYAAYVTPSWSMFYPHIS